MTATRLVVDVAVSRGTAAVRAQFRSAGGITVLWGPSGAGKTTTVATVAGLVRPDEGTVVMDGETVADAASGVHVRTQDRRLGMVFQREALLVHRSPLDNVAIAVRDPSGRGPRRAVASELLARVGAANLAGARTATLSGGETRRVALARALAGRPRLLLLDEPFTGLDHTSRAALRDVVRDEVDRAGATAIVVTHDLDDVTALADQVVVLGPGGTDSTFGVGRGAVPRVLELLGSSR